MIHMKREYINCFLSVATVVLMLPFTACRDGEPGKVLYSLTLIVLPADAGWVEGAGEYGEKEEAGIVAFAEEGYKFIKWTGNGEGEISFDAEFTYSMPARDDTLTAVFTEDIAVPGDGVTDIDGNFYETVHIGAYEWMASNLKTTTYNDGTDIPHITGNEDWDTAADAYCWYGNDQGNAEMAGGLYNWYAVATGRLCPAGWRVPSDEEWRDLEGSTDTGYGADDPEWDKGVWRGKDAGDRLKDISGWEVNRGTDNYGFSALPGGLRNYWPGKFEYSGNHGFWWTATEENDLLSWGSYLKVDSSRVARHPIHKNVGLSVRCIKNN